MSIDHAEAIGADQTNAASSRRRANPVLQPTPVIADFGEAAGQDHGGPRVGLRTIFDGSKTASVGTAMSARSTGSGTSRMVG